jgi:hypothetical protein
MLRGIYVELLRRAVEYYAGKRNGKLRLSSSDLIEITGCEQVGGAVQRIRRAVKYITEDGKIHPRCNPESPLIIRKLPLDTVEVLSKFGSSSDQVPVKFVSSTPTCWELEVPNFVQKQGFEVDYGTPPIPTPIPTPIREEEDIEREIADWSKLLSKEEGSWEQKIKWLEKNLPVIQNEAQASFPNGKPTSAAVNGKIRSLIFRWYRNHLRNPSGIRRRNNYGGRKTALDAAENILRSDGFI